MSRVAGFLIIGILALGTVVVAAGAPGGAAQRSDGTPAANCTVWHANASDPLGPDGCALSAPWWTVWATCPVTPVHGEPWQGEGGLVRIPWVQAEPAAAGLVGHLFFGDRPLHTGNHFPDGARAKVLWTFDHPVAGLTLTATNQWGKGAPLSLGGDPNDPATAQDWPSYIAIPTAGCWRVDLRAHDGHGPIAASVTFIVVGN